MHLVSSCLSLDTRLAYFLVGLFCFSCNILFLLQNHCSSFNHRVVWRFSIWFTFVQTLTKSTLLKCRKQKWPIFQLYIYIYCDMNSNWFYWILADQRLFLRNSLWPSDATWCHGSGSSLAQVMACCLTAPSHYLNQYCFLISKVHWHSHEGNFTRYLSHKSLK